MWCKGEEMECMEKRRGNKGIEKESEIKEIGKEKGERSADVKEEKVRGAVMKKGEVGCRGRGQTKGNEATTHARTRPKPLEDGADDPPSHSAHCPCPVVSASLPVNDERTITTRKQIGEKDHPRAMLTLPIFYRL